MSGNLPPGVTPANIDRHYGGAVPDHEHEWMPVEELSPILEDMAAIFHEQCRWAEIVDSYTDHRRDETYYETGAECEAERHYRFELAYVAELTEKGRPDLRLDREELNQLGVEGDELFDKALNVVVETEKAFPDETEIIEIDPDRQQGRVVLRYDRFEIGYGPGINGGDA